MSIRQSAGSVDVRRAGFSLVEVLVAVAVLEVGLLGAVGTLVLAERLLTRAERVHEAVLAAGELADSLHAVEGSGVRAHRWGRLAWSETGIEAVDAEGQRLVSWPLVRSPEGP